MRYNRSEIMKAAWKMVKELGLTISEGLKKAWAAAKEGSLRTSLTVKEWVIDKAQQEADAYTTYIDKKDAGNGFVTIIASILKETEKAVYVKAETGSCVGSIKGWKLWIPKSQLA